MRHQEFMLNEVKYIVDGSCWIICSRPNPNYFNFTQIVLDLYYT